MHSRIGRRKRKQLSRQLRKLLLSKGIEDTLTFKLLGTKPVATGRWLPDGKPEIVTVDVRQAVNNHRNLIRRVRNLDQRSVKLFLDSLDSALKGGSDGKTSGN